MRGVLLVSAAALAAIPAAPAAAQHWSDPGTIAAANVTVHRGSPEAARGFGRDRDSHWRGDRRDRRRHGDFGTVWLNPYVDHRDRTFEHDSYNDWWHERPHRAFPRWVADNRNCDRIWWSGGTWRC